MVGWGYPTNPREASGLNPEVVHQLQSDDQLRQVVRFYLQDTGLVTALADEPAAGRREDLQRETDLARVAGFDHTMRLAYGLTSSHP